MDCRERQRKEGQVGECAIKKESGRRSAHREPDMSIVGTRRTTRSFNEGTQGNAANEEGRAGSCSNSSGADVESAAFAARRCRAGSASRSIGIRSQDAT